MTTRFKGCDDAKHVGVYSHWSDVLVTCNAANGGHKNSSQFPYAKKKIQL